MRPAGRRGVSEKTARSRVMKMVSALPCDSNRTAGANCPTFVSNIIGIEARAGSFDSAAACAPRCSVAFVSELAPLGPSAIGIAMMEQGKCRPGQAHRSRCPGIRVARFLGLVIQAMIKAIARIVREVIPDALASLEEMRKGDE